MADELEKKRRGGPAIGVEGIPMGRGRAQALRAATKGAGHRRHPADAEVAR